MFANYKIIKSMNSMIPFGIYIYMYTYMNVYIFMNYIHMCSCKKRSGERDLSNS